MEESTVMDHFITQAQQLLREGKEWDSVRRQLSEAGADEVTVETIIRQVKSINYLKSRKRGFVLGVCGSVLLMIGFLLTVLFYHSGISIHVVMYSMTSAGVILLVAGLIHIIGW